MTRDFKIYRRALDPSEKKAKAEKKRIARAVARFWKTDRSRYKDWDGNIIVK